MLNDELLGALTSISKNRNSERNCEIAMKYLGFDGCGGKRNGNSMQSVGEPYGLTREMVRQIVAAFQDLAHLVNPRKDLPSLIASIKHLHTIAPCDAVFAEQSLVDQGLAQRPFRIEGILAAAEIFNVALKDLALSHYRQGRFLVNRAVHDEIPSALLSKAGSLVSHNGAVHIQDLIRTLSRDHGIRLPKSKSYGFVPAARRPVMKKILFGLMRRGVVYLLKARP